MTWSVGVRAWRGKGEASAVISSAHLSPADPRVDHEGLRGSPLEGGRFPLETHVGLRGSPLEIHLGQIRIAYVTKRILGRIQLFECAKFILGLVQFDDLLFAFVPSFLSLRSLLSGRPSGEEKIVLRNSDLLEPGVFGLNYVLRRRKGFLNGIVSEDLVSSSDLLVAFVHKTLCAKNGL